MWCVSASLGVRAQGGTPALTGPTSGAPGQWSTFQYQSGAASSSANWPADHFWHVLGADSVAGIPRADLLDDQSFRTPTQTVSIRWAASTTSGLVQARAGIPNESALLVERTVTMEQPSGGTGITIVGADTASGSKPEIYTVQGLAAWTDDYFWHVEGADSIQGVDLGDYLDDGSFQTSGPQVTLFASESSPHTIISLMRKSSDGPVQVATFTAARYRGDRITADQKPANTANWRPRTRRGDQILICSSSDWGFAVTYEATHQWYKIIYYTESGSRYEELWEEHETVNSGGYLYPHDITTFYARWYEYVPASPYPTNNSTDQPDYFPSDVSGMVWNTYHGHTPVITNVSSTATPGERIVRAKIISYSEGLRVGSWVDRRLDVNYSVIPIAAFRMNATALCANNTYTAVADIDATTWYNEVAQ